MTKFVADDNSLYAKPEWWDEEYKKCKPEDQYEWFSGTNDQHLLEAIFTYLKDPNQKIINLGCGISHIQDVIYDKGFHDITNVDVSPTCIQNMKQTDTRGMKWDIVDVMEPFPYPPETFDFALDKGTLDAIIIDKADHWEIEDEVYDLAKKYFKNVYDSLKPGGTFIQITFGQPHFRRRLFENCGLDWTINVRTILPDHSFHFFCYECTKNPK